MPDKYTENYFFEFSGGYCTYRRLATTPDSEAHTAHIYDYSEALKKKLMADLFTCEAPRTPKMLDLTLAKHCGRNLPITKLKSLAKKYFSIPVKYRSFYPEALVTEASKLAKKVEPTGRKRKKPRDGVMRKVKRKVGRPKGLAPIPKGVQSVASYFRKL